MKKGLWKPAHRLVCFFLCGLQGYTATDRHRDIQIYRHKRQSHRQSSPRPLDDRCKTHSYKTKHRDTAPMVEAEEAGRSGDSECILGTVNKTHMSPGPSCPMRSR